MCAETTSPNYAWIKPDIGGDSGNWGNVLNATIDAVDSVVYANQQAGLPIGSVSMFAGATAPVNWLICDGSSLSTTGTYAALFAILQYAYGGSGGNFNLPNLQNTFPRGASATNLGAKGGTNNVTLTAAQLPSHSHPIIDVTHSHTAQQNSHSHVIATGGHNHALHDNGHTHTYATLGGGVNIQSGSGGNMSNTGNTGLSGTGITIDGVGNLGGNTDTQQPAVGVNASGTGLSTTQAVGGGSSVSTVPTYVTLNFIVRYM